MSNEATPHRSLKVRGSGYMRGADVEALQKAINKRLSARGLDGEVTVDGEYGPKTHAAALRALYYLGVTRASCFMVTVHPTGFSRRAQQYVRVLRERNKWQRARGNKRLAAYASGPAAAIRWARQQIGTTEDPAGSNKGPGICNWQVHWLGWCGYSWCGAFAGYALYVAGVKGLYGKNIVYTPAIVNDARAGRNGFKKLVSLKDAQAGDLLLYNWDGGVVDHVELFTGERVNGLLVAIGGNTSPDDHGSQSNGGGVFERHRAPSLVQYVARPRW